ncbi:TPA: fimbrial protein [Serratia fonticola]
MSIFKKNMLVLALVSSAAFAANAADQGSGTVTFTGSIIDAPCSITPDSIDQTVNLGEVSQAALASQGTSIPRNFAIDLQNCDLATLNKVSITFNGSPDAANADLLGITGTAKGAGIVITDGSGSPIKLGVASAARALGEGNNTLAFSAYLKGSSAAVGSVKPGSFSSVADFTLAYQ